MHDIYRLNLLLLFKRKNIEYFLSVSYTCDTFSIITKCSLLMVVPRLSYYSVFIVFPKTFGQTTSTPNFVVLYNAFTFGDMIGIIF